VAGSHKMRNTNRRLALPYLYLKHSHTHTAKKYRFNAAVVAGMWLAKELDVT